MPISIPHAYLQVVEKLTTSVRPYTNREMSSKAWISVSEKPFSLAITLHLCRNCSKLDGSIVSFFIFFDVMAFPIVLGPVHGCSQHLARGTAVFGMYTSKNWDPRDPPPGSIGKKSSIPLAKLTPQKKKVQRCTFWWWKILWFCQNCDKLSRVNIPHG